MDLPAREIPKRDICLNLSRLNWVAVLFPGDALLETVGRWKGTTGRLDEICVSND